MTNKVVAIVTTGTTILAGIRLAVVHFCNEINLDVNQISAFKQLPYIWQAQALTFSALWK